MIFFPRTQERVRNRRGKRVISIRATEVLLYILPCLGRHVRTSNGFVKTRSNSCGRKQKHASRSGSSFRLAE